MLHQLLVHQNSYTAKNQEGPRRTDEIFIFYTQTEPFLALERRKYHNLFDPTRFEKKPKDLDRMWQSRITAYHESDFLARSNAQMK